MTRIARTGGRVLIVDESGRMLLIHEWLEDGSTHWLTPGGGVEDDEEPRAAAEREALEETGIELVVPSDAEPVLVTRRDWEWGELEFDQIDHFFAVRVPDSTPVRPRKLTDVEQQTWIGTRWWTLDELRATDAVLLPPDLADVLERLLGAGGG